VRGLASQCPTEWCLSVACRTLSKGPCVLFPVGTVDHGTPETRCSWHGAAEAFSHRGEKPAREEGGIHPLAQAEGLSGPFSVMACRITFRQIFGPARTQRVITVAPRWTGKEGPP
jgi:hypothetical protein